MAFHFKRNKNAIGDLQKALTPSPLTNVSAPVVPKEFPSELERSVEERFYQREVSRF